MLPSDLRVKSRSLFNKMGHFVMENFNVTVGFCGLSAGDVIQVINDESRQTFLGQLKDMGCSIESDIIDYSKGKDISSWKQEMLKRFGRFSDDRFSHIVFERIQKNGKIFFRALYDCEELPSSLAEVDPMHCIQLWKDCEYVDLTNLEAPVKLSMAWPWGNRIFEYWTWGIVLKKCSDPSACFYLLRTTDGGFINSVDESFLGQEFQPRTSALPNTPIGKTDSRDISLFVSFFTERPPCIVEGKDIVLMCRNQDPTVPRSDMKKPHLFWTEYLDDADI